MLELDLYFERFINNGEFAKLDKEQLHIYRQLLAKDDNEILLLFQGKSIVENVEMQVLINKITSIDFYKGRVC